MITEIWKLDAILAKIKKIEMKIKKKRWDPKSLQGSDDNYKAMINLQSYISTIFHDIAGSDSAQFV